MFWNNSKGMQLYYNEWSVANPTAVIVMVHGQGEHINRYQHEAEWMNKRGYVFMGYDQQGFGQSAGARGHAASLDAYLDDIGSFLALTKDKYPNTPIYLYGHSMGGNVCLNYILRRKPDFLSGAIITGPWIRLAFEPPAIKVWAGKLMRNIWPSLALPSGLDTNFLSTVPAVVAAYNADPLVHDKVSAAAGMDLMDGAAYLNTYTGALPCPLLLMHGGADKITSAPASKEFAGRITSAVKQLEWPGMYHEIHNEPAQEQVFEAIAEWIGTAGKI
ncbi:MAG: hypothetical protein RIR11_1497 [Bacteroidota bacterium]|jgi:acylglycerol lipase